MSNINLKFDRPVVNINDAQAEVIISSLNNLLADEYALFTKTLNYHWNITGPRFYSLHKFLEESYKETLKTMDDVAERVRVLGGRPLSTVKGMSKEMNIEEKNSSEMSSSEMLGDLFTSHLMIQNLIKTTLLDESILKTDPGTEDFLVNVLGKHEMMSWALKSHLD